ncbi:transient receptor potential cation channel subfamily A member 1-like [Pollicipes pollicipes]|uniref:transient receptor potential cation channel subfamily A member 1-like n=1 Tax=Pollicipes pollicipes TaxID=41117 RepID=UPI001884EC8C|nr:transient receptor potential cation channel subfamily A member 1-like [Pollicipes pollicipes]
MSWRALVNHVTQRARGGSPDGADVEGMPAGAWARAVGPAVRPGPEDENQPSALSLSVVTQKWRALLRRRPAKSAAASGGSASSDGRVCFVKTSPYRILRCAGAGDLKTFRDLHQEDPSRLQFRDAQRGRCPAHYAAMANQTEIIKYIASVGGDINTTDDQGQTPVHTAVESSSLDALGCLLDCGARVDVLDASQRSPFHLAVWLDRPHVLRLLVRYRHLVDCAQLTEHGRDALHVAAVLNRADCARILCAGAGDLKTFRDLHQEDPSRLQFRDAQRGRCPAHYAAMANQTEIIKYIAGARVDVLDASQRSPFHLAVWLDRPHVLRLLVRYRHLVDCAQLTEHGRDALHVAAVLNRADCARILLDDFNMVPKRFCQNGFTPVHEASRRASFATMQVFTGWAERNGCSLMQSPDAEGHLPLHLAVHSGDVQAVELCLQHGADITSQQDDLSTPVHLACVQGSLKITQLMFSAQPKVKWPVLNMRDSADMTPLHCAAKFDHAVLVEFLCRQGADVLALDSEESLGDLSIPDQSCPGRSNASAFAAMVNCQDSLGCTPLHYASRDGHIQCLQDLMEHGACPDVKNANNENPLHCAARFGRYHTVDSLLGSAKGQQIINGMDYAGRTPLHIASENGHLRVVHLLIGKGALLNRDFEGLTPLHLAAREGYTRTMGLLLNTHSQLLDQKDKAGNTALHLACLANRVSAAGLLLSLGCALVANAGGYTALDICIKHKLVEVARVMLTNEQASRRALADTQGKNKYTVAALIDVMPNIMKDVMDKHITFASGKRTAETFSITYDLSLFEPSAQQVASIRAARADSRWRPQPLTAVNITYDLSLFEPSAQQVASIRATRADSRWRPQPLTAVNHMVRHGRIELLMHPLTQKYLEMKWQAYGRFCHLLSLLLYAAFVILVTVHGMNLMHLVRKCAVLLEDGGSVDLASEDAAPPRAGARGCDGRSQPE